MTRLKMKQLSENWVISVWIWGSTAKRLFGNYIHDDNDTLMKIEYNSFL